MDIKNITRSDVISKKKTEASLRCEVGKPDRNVSSGCYVGRQALEEHFEWRSR